MDKRKIGIIAILLFLIIGLGTFVFANPDNQEKMQNSQNEEIDSSKDDNKVQKEETSKNKSSKDANIQNILTHKNVTTNKVTNIVIQTKNYYEEALKAVIDAETSLNQGDVNYATSLINKISDEKQKEKLNQRLKEVQNIIDVTSLMNNLEIMIINSKNRKEIEQSIDYRDNQKIEKLIQKLKEGKAKNQLENRLTTANIVLNDNQQPTIVGISNNSFTNQEVTLKITDNNKVNTSVTKNNDKIDYNGKFTEDGKYVVEATDSAFNKTTLTFTIDKTNPIINIEGTTGSKNWFKNQTISVKVNEDNLENIYYAWNQSNNDNSMYNVLNSDKAIKADSKDIIKNDDGTYTLKIKNTKEGRHVLNIKVTDKTGNITYKRKGWFQLDNTAPTINSASVSSATKSVKINVKDKNTNKINPKEFLVAEGYTSDKNLKISLETKDLISGIKGIYISEKDSTNKAKWIAPNEKGIYDYQLQSDINGKKDIYVFVKDKAENITKTKLEIIYDNKPATIKHNKNTIENGQTYYYNASFKGKAEDNSGINVITLNSAIRTDINVSGMGYKYTYQILDKAGNIGTYKIILDNVAPVVEGVEENGIYPNGVTLNVTDDNLLDTLTLTKDGVEVPFENGQKITEFGKYIIIAVDKAGNKKEVNFKIGKNDTTIEFIAPSDLVYDGKEKQFTAKLIDEKNEEVKDIKIIPVYFDSKGNKTTPVNAGNYEVRAYFAGNDVYSKSYKSMKFTVEKYTPTTKIIAPSSLIYDGKAKEYQVQVLGINNTDITSSSNINITYKNQETLETLATAPTNVGKYNLNIQIAESTNYNAINENISFEILPIVSIGDQNYSSINEAIEHANQNDTIVILQNIKEDVVIPNGKTVTLDLNNKKLTGNKVITNKGTLSVINGTIETTNNGIINNGTIEMIDNITINAERTGINNVSGIIKSVTNSKIESIYYPIYNAGTSRIDKLENNEIMGHYMDGIYLADSSTIGEIVSGTYYTDGKYKEEGSVAGFGLYISTNAKIEKISGGNFKGSKAAVANYGEILSITGGEFEKKYGNNIWELSWTFLYSGKIKNISGGTFYSYNGKVQSGIFRSNNYELAQGYDFVQDGEFFKVQKIN